MSEDSQYTGSEITPGHMMAYALEKAHGSKFEASSGTHNRRNEAVCEFMLEYCLLITDMRKALIAGLKPCDHHEAYDLQYKYANDNDGKSKERNYPDIRLKCRDPNCGQSVVMELKLDAEFTANQETRGYWQGSKSIIVCPLGRQGLVEAWVTQRQLPNVQVLSWERLTHAFKIAGNQAGLYGPLLQTLVNFAENAGLTLPPGMAGTRPFGNQDAVQSMSTALQPLEEQLKAFPGSKNLNFWVKSDRSLATNPECGQTNLVFSLDAADSDLVWPFWLGYKPKGSPDRVWLRTPYVLDSAAHFVHQDLADELDYWRGLLLGAQAQALPNDVYPGAGQALTDLGRTPQCLEHPCGNDLKELVAAVSCRIGNDNAAQPNNTAEDAKARLKQMALLAETASDDQVAARLLQLMQLALLAETASGFTPVCAQKVEGFGAVWTATMLLHQHFARWTVGLYQAKLRSTLGGTVEHDGMIEFPDEGGWELSQWVSAPGAADNEGKPGLPLVKLTTKFQGMKASLTVKHEPWLNSSATKNSSATTTLTGNLGEMLSQLRDQVGKAFKDDADTLAVEIVRKDANAVIAVSNNTNAGKSFSECVQYMQGGKGSDWAGFRENVLAALGDFDPVAANAIGVQREQGDDTETLFEPSLVIGLRKGEATRWAQAAVGLAEAHHQKKVRVTILNQQHNGGGSLRDNLSCYESSTEYRFRVRADQLTSLGNMINDHRFSGNLGSWCGNVLTINGTHSDQIPHGYVSEVCGLFGPTFEMAGAGCAKEAQGQGTCEAASDEVLVGRFTNGCPISNPGDLCEDCPGREVLAGRCLT